MTAQGKASVAPLLKLASTFWKRMSKVCREKHTVRSEAGVLNITCLVLWLDDATILPQVFQVSNTLFRGALVTIFRLSEIRVFPRPSTC